MLGGITILLLGAMVLMVLRLLDQSESHVKAVKGMKVKFATTQFQPGLSETSDEIERDLKADPKRTIGNYRNRELNERSFKLISRMKNLTTLELCDCDFDQNLLRYIDHLPLMVLDLSGNDVTDEAIKHVVNFKTTLRTLKLPDTKCSGDCLVYVKDCKELHDLEINGLDVDDEDLKSIENCPIQWLSVAGTKVTNAGCESLAKIVMLQKLDVSRTKITGVGLLRLLPLVNLIELQMKDCDLKDTDMAIIARFPKLEALHLNRCKLTDDGLMLLGKSKSLRSVMLINCPNITKAGSSRFCQNFKKIGLGVNQEKSEFSKYKDFIPE